MTMALERHLNPVSAPLTPAPAPTATRTDSQPSSETSASQTGAYSVRIVFAIAPNLTDVNRQRAQKFLIVISVLPGQCLGHPSYRSDAPHLIQRR
jgi:hypothetical protein